MVFSECQKEGSRCKPAVQRVVFWDVVCSTRLKFRVVRCLSGKGCVVVFLVGVCFSSLSTKSCVSGVKEAGGGVVGYSSVVEGSGPQWFLHHREKSVCRAVGKG